MDYPEPELDITVPNAPNEQVPDILDDVWLRDEQWTEAYRTFAAQQPLIGKKGVEVTPMSRSLLDDDTATPHLVTRKEQRDVVERAFQESRGHESCFPWSIKKRRRNLVWEHTGEVH